MICFCLGVKYLLMISSPTRSENYGYLPLSMEKLCRGVAKLPKRISFDKQIAI